jgi:uncharacterized protein (DUF433 family)
MGGKACIRGLRVTVGMVVGQIAAGRSIADLARRLPLPRTRRHPPGPAEEREVMLASA